jgi:small conductance mechanosensitive channel
MLEYTISLRALFAVVVLLVAVTGAPCRAEQSDDTGSEQQAAVVESEQVMSAAQALSEEIEQLRIAIDDLKKQYRDAKGEEKAILASQIRSKRGELAKSLQELAAQIEELDAEADDVARLGAVTKKLLQGTLTDLEASLVEGAERIVQLREQRSDASGEELEALDKEIEERAIEVDEDLSAYFVLADLLTVQGVDASKEFDFLDRELQKRAEQLSGIINFLTQERATATALPSGATDEEKQAQLEVQKATDERIQAVASHLNATVEIMKKRDLDTAPYTQLLIESTGELTEDIFQTEVAIGLLQGWLDSGKDWLIENGPRWLFKIIVFLLILVAFKFLAGIAKRVVRRAVTTWRINLSQLLQEQIVSFAGKVVMFLGILVALSQLGIQLAPLLAGLGIAGFIVGFALQDTLSNFASGMMILVYRPYDVGDAVEAGGVMGTVKAMNLVSTTIATWDNQKLVVPNSKIWGDVIRNITAEPNRRVDMTFGIAYADDVDQAEKVLADIVAKHELVLAEPEPVIRLHTLGESSVDFVVRPWARTSDYWAVYWDITRAVKKRFDEEGISIPFPQRDVHLIKSEAST